MTDREETLPPRYVCTQCGDSVSTLTCVAALHGVCTTGIGHTYVPEFPEPQFNASDGSGESVECAETNHTLPEPSLSPTGFYEKHPDLSGCELCEKTLAENERLRAALNIEAETESRYQPLDSTMEALNG